MTNRKSLVARTTLSSFLSLYVLLAITPGATAQTDIVDAAVFTNNHAYFFLRNTYVRFTGTTRDVNYPRELPGGWRNLPRSFQNGIDAALFFPPKRKVYFFKGNQYVRITGTEVDDTYPRDLPGGWEGLPRSFWSGIDAAIYTNGHTYFFKGNEYVRFTGTKMDAKYPQKLPGGWNMASSFHSNISAAIAFPPKNKNYFFKANQYIRLRTYTMDSGYPADLPGGWTGLLNPCNVFAKPPTRVASNIISGTGGLRCESFPFPAGEPVLVSVRLRQHRPRRPDRTLGSLEMLGGGDLTVSYRCKRFFNPISVFTETIADGYKTKSPTRRLICIPD